MAEVDILMAAYNGEKYIAEQIESILAQTYQDFRLLIRDDDSTDGTPAIIGEYAARYPGKIVVVHDDVECHDAAKNFFQLLTYAEADYVMFSDQDDVWLPYKVKLTRWYMKRTELENPNKPVMVFTGLELVDENMKSLDCFMSYDLRKSKYEFDSLLIYGNVAAGCTMMINRNLWETLGKYEEPIDLHDRWIALFASACGVVCHIHAATIFYRQHSDNAVGAAVLLEGKWQYRLKKLLQHVRKPFSDFTKSKEIWTLRREQCVLFRKRYESLMPPDKLQQLDNYFALFSPNRFTRLMALPKSHFLAQNGMYTTILQIIKMLLF